MAEALRRPVALPDPPTVPEAAPEPCASCKEYKKLVREQKRTMTEQQTQIDRLTRAVQRDSRFYELRSVTDGKRHME